MRYIVALLALLLIAGCASDNGAPVVVIDAEVPEDEIIETGSDADVTFSLTGENFFFEMDGQRNPTLRVNEGDLVRVEFASVGGFHDWVVDGFDAATLQVYPENGTTVVEFVASVVGEYEYYCSVGSHRENGMKGVFVVE